MPHAHTDSVRKHAIHRWELGLVATAAAVITAPYLLPMIGVGDQAMAARIAGICSSTPGGLTNLVEGALGSVPGVGQWLASAGWGASLTSGAIGVAGVMLGDYVHRHYDRKGHIQWGTVIKYAALTTSMLIALPSILSGISMGVAYLSYALSGGSEAALGVAKNILAPTIGFSGLQHLAPTGLAGLAPHLFTCGRALLPASLALFANHQRNTHVNADEERYAIQMVSAPQPIQGVPCEVAFRLVDAATNRPLSDAELETVHTRKLHTMIVDRSLNDYHHLHPTYDPERKLFTCHFTPALQAEYSMWNDFNVKGEQNPTYLKTSISSIRGLGIAPRIMHTSQTHAHGLTINIQSEQPLRVGESNQLTLDIRDEAGQPLNDLEPLMGAYAHLVGFSADGKHFIHSHPMGEEPNSPAQRGHSPLQFHVTPPASGASKFFLQIQRNGRIETIPFGQMVAKSRTLENHRTAGTSMMSTRLSAMGR